MDEFEEPKELEPQESVQPEQPTGGGRWNVLIYLVLIALLGVIGILTYGIYSQGERTQAQDPVTIALSVPQEKIYLAAMTDYLCPCGACDLTFIDCHCPTAQQVQLAVRQRLQDGATAGEVSQLLEVTFEAEKVRP